jgi:hypothetical protein
LKTTSLPAKYQIDKERALSLLRPIAEFLSAGGLSKIEAAKIFSEVIDRVAAGPRVRKIEHIGHPRPYADVIALWIRDKRFIDNRGRPAVLSLTGANSFTTLIRSVDPGARASAFLRVLVRYGNVRRSRRGHYELVTPFFNTSSPRMMAFEPAAFFLSDASSTLGRILKRRNRSDWPDLFWQKTESNQISDATAKRFNTFARERSLVFLDELDDWLEANRTSNHRGSKRGRRRIGLGLFSIYSKRESLDPSV